MRAETGAESFNPFREEIPDPLAKLNGPKKALNTLAGRACAHSLLVRTGAGGKKEYAVHDDHRVKIIIPGEKDQPATSAKLWEYTVLQSFNPNQQMTLSDGRNAFHFHGNQDGAFRWSTPPGEDHTWDYTVGNGLPGVPYKVNSKP